MRSIQLNQTLGFYTPGFFRLHIATLTPIDLSSLTDREMATFVHEYTHFLQDFTTITGLQNIYTIFELCRLFVTETYKHRKVTIPVNFNHEVISANIILRNCAFGTLPNPTLNRITSLQNIRVEQTIPAETIGNHPELSSFRAVKADAILPDGTIRQIEIGTLAVMESMSHFAEGLMGLQMTQSPDYPYNAVRLLADVVCPSFRFDDEVLFAMCDVALQCSMPGFSIYTMLANIQNGTVQSPKNGYEIYQQYAVQFQIWKVDGSKSLINESKDHLTKLVQGPMGERFGYWIDNLFKFAVSIRKLNPAFFLDEFRKKSNYSEIVTKIGTPLMVNAAEDYTKVPVNPLIPFPCDWDVEFFVAIEYIMNLFLTGKRNCPMLSWCKSSNIRTDNNCITNPPARCDTSKYQELCPVGALWRSWNLSRYKLNSQYLYRPICK